MHPDLIAEHFTLRIPRAADAPAIASACRDPEIVRWCPIIPLNYTLEDAKDFIAFCESASEAGTELVWAIDASGEFCGLVTLRPHGEDSAEIGYWMAPHARGRGLLSQALRVMMGFAFDPAGLGLDSLKWTAIEGNTASRRVAQKAGFENMQRVERGLAGRVDSAGNETCLPVWAATLTRTQWLNKFFRV